MRIAYGSDFHLEHGGPTIPEHPPCDLLVLAGDIHTGMASPALAGLLTAHSKVPTILVPGNHESYGESKADLDKLYHEFEHENVMICNPGVVEHGDFVIIGATLYSALQLPGYTQYPPLAFHRAIGDFSATRDWNALDHVARHIFERDFIAAELEKNRGRRCIVVTHFVPTMQCIAPFYIGSDLNPYFINDLDSIIDEYKPEAWFFGHTHTPFNTTHSNGVTKLLCNPKGYPGERKRTFSWELVEL